MSSCCSIASTAWVLTIASIAAAQQVPAPQAPADVVLPADGITMSPAYAQSVARSAYIWGWPMVNMLNRRAAITKAAHPGLLNGVLPAAPRGQVSMLHDYIEPSETFVTCPNQDVVYGLGFFSLDEEPVIAQVPDFGDRFWVYALYDARTDQFGELGKPYGTKPGFYLLVGPTWKGEKPAGVDAIIRSRTALANAIPRIFMDDTPEDREAIQTVSLRFSDEGSLTLYAGAKSPGPGMQSNWLPAPQARFSLYIRAYWGKQGILDGSWKPPVIKKAN